MSDFLPLLAVHKELETYKIGLSSEPTFALVAVDLLAVDLLAVDLFARREHRRGSRVCGGFTGEDVLWFCGVVGSLKQGRLAVVAEERARLP
jgi:hypothetical protein